MTSGVKEIGERIRAARRKQSLSQEELAEMADLSTSYIGQIERGEKNPGTDKLMRIAGALEIPLSMLLEHEWPAESGAAYRENPKWKRLVRLSKKVDEEVLDVLLMMLRLLRRREKEMRERKSQRRPGPVGTRKKSGRARAIS